MSRSRQFVRGAALSGASTMVSVAAALALAKLATNTLPQGDVASWLIVVLVADGLNLLFNFGLFASLPALIAAREQARQMPYIQGVLKGQARVSLGVLAAALATAVILPLSGQPATYGILCATAGALACAGIFRDTLLAVINGLQDYRLHAAGSIAFGVSQVVLGGAALWCGGGLMALLLALLISQAVCAVALAYIVLRGAPWHPEPAFAQAARFSIPLYANSLLNYGFQRADTFLVTALLGVNMAGVYEIAKRFPQLLSRGLNALLLPWLPSIAAMAAAGRKEDAGRTLTEVLVVITFLGHSMIVAAYPLREWLVLLLSSPEYIGAADAITPLMLGIHLAVQAGVFGQTLIALERPEWVTFGQASQAVLSLASAAVLMPLMGLRGAGLAWVIGAGASMTFQAIAVRRAGVHPRAGSRVPQFLFFIGSLSVARVTGIGILAPLLFCLTGVPLAFYLLRHRLPLRRSA